MPKNLALQTPLEPQQVLLLQCHVPTILSQQAPNNLGAPPP